MKKNPNRRARQREIDGLAPKKGEQPVPRDAAFYEYREEIVISDFLPASELNKFEAQDREEIWAMSKKEQAGRHEFNRVCRSRTGGALRF